MRAGIFPGPHGMWGPRGAAGWPCFGLASLCGHSLLGDWALPPSVLWVHRLALLPGEASDLAKRSTHAHL